MKDSASRTKTSWNPPKGDPHLDLFLSRIEEELFTATERSVRHSNLSKEEWKVIRSLSDDRNIVIKKKIRAPVLSYGILMVTQLRQKNNSPIKTYISRSVLNKKPCVTSYRHVIGSSMA